MWRKDGSVSEYGNTADSAFNPPGANGATLTWAQNRFEDSAAYRGGGNNAVLFSYAEDSVNGEHRIERIQYANLAAEIEFFYETRVDSSTAFVAGASMQTTQRLARVETRNSGDELRTYNLTYQQGSYNNVSQLTAIQECNGAVCLPATAFDWANEPIGMAGTLLDRHQGGFLGGRPADLNGDGIAEFVWTRIEVSRRDVDYDLRMFAFDGVNSWNDSGSFTIRVHDRALNSWSVIDYNGDGKQDLIYARGDNWYVRPGIDVGGVPDVGTEVLVAPRLGPVEQTVVADANGDGLADIIAIEEFSGAFRTSVNVTRQHLEKSGGTGALAFAPVETYALPTAHSSASFCAQAPYYHCSIFPQEVKPIVQDFNGDGNVDLLVREEHRVECFEEPSLCNNLPDPVQVWALYLAHENGYTHHHNGGVSSLGDTIRLFGDINGDGLADRVSGSTNQSTGNLWFFSVNSGVDFLGMNAQFESLTDKQAKQAQLFDYNGDGRADFLYPSATSSQWMVRYWNGSGFDPAVGTGLAARETGADLDEWTTAFFDGDGDGRLDAIVGETVDGSGQNNAYMNRANAPYAPTNVITRITNGFGAETDITFNALTDPNTGDLFTPSTDGLQQNWGNGAPVFDVNAPMYVVAGVSSSAPVAGNTGAKSSVSYEYAGARMQADGRGYLGFESVASIDDQTGVRTTTTYRQDFPFIGRPEQTTTTTASGQVLATATNTWQDHNATGALGPMSQPYLASATEDTYDLAAPGLHLQRAVTTTTVNDYGDVLTMDVVTSDQVSGETFSKDVTNQYAANDPADWRLGRLTHTSVTHWRSNAVGSAVVRTSSFGYDGATGQLTSETVEPGGANQHVLATSYGLDALGNRTSANVQGWKGANLPGDTGATTVTRSSFTDFDSIGRYATQTRNALGHVTAQITSRNAFGSPLQVLDINGNATDTAYGALGRQYFTLDAAGGFTHAIHRMCSAVSCPAGAEFRVETNAAGGGRAFGYFDRLGRDVRMSTVGFDGTHIHVDTEYDALGRVSRKSEPYYAGAPVYWTSFTYDILGRVTQTTHPDNSTSATAFNGFTTVATNQLSQTRTETKNAMGDLVRTEDHLGGYVDFTYDHQGNLTRTEQGGPGVTPVVTTITYDLLGRKIAMADPDMGNWTYEYNAFGELVKQTTAKGDETLVAHDLLGRMVRRLDNDAFGGGFIAEADANWLYDTAVNGLGQLASEETDDGGATPPLRRMFEYDALGRTSSVHTHIVKDSVTESYQQRTTYDEFGRVFQQYDGADVDTGVEYYYNPNGYLEYAIEAQNSANQSDEYYRVLTMDARGNVTQLRKRGVTVTTAYHAARGTMNSVHAQDVATTTLQDLSFTFDAVGNLTAKTNQNRTVGGAYRDLTESYNYDHLNRLTSVTQGTESLVMDYDALGNLTSKSDVGAYTYGSGAGPHAVTSAGGQTYVYDANGNQVSGDGRTIGYTVFNKPNDITRGARDVDVAYGPNRNRYMRVDNEGQSSEVTTHYIGSIERIWRASGVVETKRYIDGEVIVTRSDDGSTVTSSVAVLLKDHLGSTDLIVDDAGQIVQAQSFDPWGKRRAPDYASLIGAAWYDYDNSATTRGFTGHEQLDPVGLVHMNGRVYDPKLGRFLSADPFVQAPANTQSYNRYAYVLNNPLSYTDPDGYFFKKLFGNGVLRSLLSTAISIWLPGAGFLIDAVGQWGAVFVSGFAAGVAANGSLRGGVMGAFSSGLFHSIGSAFAACKRCVGSALGSQLNAASLAAKSTLHGIAGGVMNVLQGGKFGHGFASASVTQLASGAIGRIDAGSGRSFNRVAVAAVLGGTVSEVTGGKFANGAIVGAFSRAFNDETEMRRQARTGEMSMEGRLDVAVYGEDAGYQNCGMLETCVDKASGLLDDVREQVEPETPDRLPVRIGRRGSGRDVLIQIGIKAAKGEGILTPAGIRGYCMSVNTGCSLPYGDPRAQYGGPDAMQFRMLELRFRELLNVPVNAPLLTPSPDGDE